MKRILLFVIIISNVVIGADSEKEIKSKITKATVFLSGAQVTRESSISLTKGKTLLKFNELSPYIDKNSIKVKGVGSYTILSVNHNVNYLKNPEQTTEANEALEKVRKLNSDLKFKQAEKNILTEKKEFISINSKIISDEKSMTPTDFKMFKDIYYSELENLQISILKKQREINELNKEIGKLNSQIQDIKSVKDLPTSEITVSVSSTADLKGKLVLSYYVSNAGWYPSYDIRVENIGSAAMLNYKANVYQNTGIDWKNVSLTFSNASPSESANIPTLYPYYLDFNNYRTDDVSYQYNPNIREVYGVVRDAETNEPIPYANITIKDKTIGTTIRSGWKFFFSDTPWRKSLRVTYIGYNTKEVPISGSYIDIPLNLLVHGIRRCYDY